MRKLLSSRIIAIIAMLAVIAVSIFGFSVSVNSQTPTATASPRATASPTPTQNIVDVATADGRFTRLVAALKAAKLVDTLKGPGPFTVFAPTDDAFNKLPAGTVDALLKDIPTLKNILLYHVVSGKIQSSDILKITSATTVQKGPLKIGLMVNGAEVIIPDVMATNGVIHGIDTVLIPVLPVTSPTPTASRVTSPTPTSSR